MGQFLRINGDYNIKTADGSKITLDTGPDGEVLVTGNLVVAGETTAVQADNLNVKDNIILVNYYEDRDNLPAGIALNYAGLQIDRGTEPPAGLFYDDVVNAWIFVEGGPSVEVTDPATPFNFGNSRIKLREIITDSTVDSGNLFLLGDSSPNGVISVTGTTTYEANVTDDDHIPNKKYVDDAIQNQPTFQIVAPQLEDTKVVIADADITPRNASQVGTPEYFKATTTYETTNSNNDSAVSIIVDGELITQFYNNYQLIGQPGVDGIEIDGRNYEIRTEGSISNQNIFVKTAGTGKLQTNNALQLDKVISPGGYVPGSLIVYAKEASIGETGVWFKNDSVDPNKRDGELISKDKALLFSMLF